MSNNTKKRKPKGLGFTLEDASGDFDEPNFFIHDAEGNQVGDNFTDGSEAEEICEKLNRGEIKPSDVHSGPGGR